MIHPSCLPVLVFKYMPRADIKYLEYIVSYTIAVPNSYSDMPIGMSTDACIQYCEDL